MMRCKTWAGLRGRMLSTNPGMLRTGSIGCRNYSCPTEQILVTCIGALRGTLTKFLRERSPRNFQSSSHRYQSQNRQSARSQYSADAARHRRRGDRITTFFTAAQNVRFWHKADMAVMLNDVRFRGQSILIGVSVWF